MRYFKNDLEGEFNANGLMTFRISIFYFKIIKTFLLHLH